MRALGRRRRSGRSETLAPSTGFDATYTFELGIDENGVVQFGTVISRTAGKGFGVVREEVGLSGLQPGTTYAYRIRLRSGYGDTVGQTLTFTTAGLPDVLAVPSVLAQLPVPAIKFPAPQSNLTPRSLTKAQKLARALKACKHKPKRQRAACVRKTRKAYAKASKSTHVEGAKSKRT